MANNTPFRLPDTMTRADIGPYMRDLREHFALSQQDVSERLHIRTRYIQAIETGALELMPGKAYAKGYVSTYAEFLGLDADQAVEICFGPEPVREEQRHFVPEPMKRSNASMPGKWRAVAVAGVMVALVLLLMAQCTGGEEDTQQAIEENSVAAVPEDMLAEMRTLVIPNPKNLNCLYTQTPLGCIIESQDWATLEELLQVETYYFADARYAPAMGKEPVVKVDKQTDDADDEKAEAKEEKPAKKEEKPAAKKPVVKKVADRPRERIKPVAIPPGAKPDDLEVKSEEKKPDTKKTDDDYSDE